MKVPAVVTCGLPLFFAACAPVGVTLPPNAVIAIDASESCPSPFVNFEDAGGRFIIASGRSEGAQPRAFREIGGTESVRLQPDQLPQHVHERGRARIAGVQAGNSLAVGDSGNKETPPNDLRTGPAEFRGEAARIVPTMPPYIALRYCKLPGRLP